MTGQPACQSGARHPDTWHSSDAGEQAEARAVCLACPLRPACQAAVLGVERGWPAMDRHGIWAGLDGEQRAALDPTTQAPAGWRTPARCGTYGAYLRHKRRGEPIDLACRAACRDNSAKRRAAAKEDAA